MRHLLIALAILLPGATASADLAPPAPSNSASTGASAVSLRMYPVLRNRRGTTATVTVRLVNAGKVPLKLLMDYGERGIGLSSSPLELAMDNGFEAISCDGGGERVIAVTLPPGRGYAVRCGRREFGTGERMRVRYSTEISLAPDGDSLTEAVCPDCWVGSAESGEIVLR